MKTHLVSGGCGFVGRNMVNRLYNSTKDRILFIDDLSVGIHPEKWIKEPLTIMHTILDKTADTSNILPIAKPPFGKLGRKLESACRKALYEFSLIKKNSLITVALSGGKDSLALLYLLNAIAKRGFDFSLKTDVRS